MENGANGRGSQEPVAEFSGDDWEVAGDTAGETGDFDVEVTPVPPEKDPLSGLHGAHRLQLWRKTPLWAEGFLGSIDLGEGEGVNLAEIKRTWGGGEILIRPMKHQGRGFRYVRGGLTVKFTGEPLEGGLPIDREGRAVVGAEARPVPAVQHRVLSPNSAGIDAMREVFGHLIERMDRLEDRLSAPPPRVDPLAEMKKSVAFLKELKGLAGMVFDGGLEDDEEDDEPADEPPSMDAMLLKLLEKKLVEDDAPKPAPQPPPQPRLIRRPSPPPQAPGTPVPMATTDVAPDAPNVSAGDASPDAAPAVSEPEPDPYHEAYANPSVASSVVDQLRAMPPEEALAVAQSVVESMPPDQVRAAVESMQADRGEGPG